LALTGILDCALLKGIEFRCHAMPPSGFAAYKLLTYNTPRMR
jgi:hypothetical protein